MSQKASQTVISKAPGPTITEFEQLRFDPENFDHEAHVYVAWSYLETYDLLTSIRRYRSTLIRLTARLGIPDKYHETMTWFFLVLVAERKERAPTQGWDLFVRDNRDLFDQEPGIIGKFYSNERLHSDSARRQFLLPDYGAL